MSVLKCCFGKSSILHPWLDTIFQKTQNQTLRKRRRAFTGERLETRLLPAQIIVTSLEDNLTEDSKVTLREALEAANGDVSVDGSAAGSGADEIRFSPELDVADVELGAITLQLGALNVSAPVRIVGNSAVKTIVDAGSLSRIFEIEANAGDVTIERLALTNGLTSGGNNDKTVNTFSGGAIHSLSSGKLLISGCRFRTNATNGAFANGGAIYSLNGNVEVQFSGFSGNTTGGASAAGGAIFSENGNVSVADSLFDSNSTSASFGRGGAIATAAGNVQISESEFQNNLTRSSDSAGGAISTLSGSINLSLSDLAENHTEGTGSPGGALHSDTGSISIDETSFTLNRTIGDSSPGAAVSVGSGSLTVLNSTMNENSTSGAGASGGALYSGTISGSVVVIQSTLSGNAVQGGESGGGAIAVEGGTLKVVQSTVTRNQVGTIDPTSLPAGGILVNSTRVTLENSIVADNTASEIAPDIYCQNAVGLNARFSLIGRNNGTGLAATPGSSSDNFGNYIGGDTLALAINPLLGSLQSNGGRTLSHAPQSGSLAINRGSNLLAIDSVHGGDKLTTDQRGIIPVPRIVNGVVDIGSFEVFSLTGPLTVGINTDEVDTIVSPEDLSLREAILLANASPGADIISFASQTNSAEFDLSLGQLVIRDALTLTGNGAAKTVLDGLLASRILDISSSSETVTISDMTLKNGRTLHDGLFWADDFYGGGAVRSAATGGLTLSQVTLSGNSTIGDYAPGGAVNASSGSLTISRSLLSGNTTSGYGSFGGAVSAGNGTNLTIADSTVSGNSTTGRWSYGGAIYSNGGDVSISRSTLSGNQTTGTGAIGGAVAFYDSSGNGKLLISNSTISGNKTSGENANGGGLYSTRNDVILSQSTLSGNATSGVNANGGGLFVSSFVSGQPVAKSLLVSQSTITLNSTVQGTAGGISSGVDMTLRNSILASNSDIGTAPDIELASGKLLSARYSLIGRSNGTILTPTTGTKPDADGNFVGGSTLATGINPQLSPLQNNGGPVFTHLPLSGSLAIDRGLNALAVDVTAVAPAPALLQDQRGTSYTRILDGDHLGTGSAAAIVDMGAAEFSGLRLISPNPNAFTLRPTMRWTAIAGAVSYDVHINNDSTGAAKFHLANSPTNSYTPPVDLALGKFTMWIRPNFATGTSSWSAPQTFSLLPAVTWKPMERTQLVAKPALQWDAMPGAVKYDLWGNNFSTGQTQTVRVNVVGTSWTPPADLSMGVHRFWIRAIDAKGNAGTWSVLYEALVVPAVKPLTPGAATFDRTPDFSWSPVTGAVSYELYVKNQNSGTMLINGLSVAGTTYTPSANITDGPYRWWVLAVSPANIGGLRSGGANSRDLFVGGRTTVITPTGTITSKRPTFSWLGVDGAASYQLSVSRTSSPAGSVISVSGINALNYTSGADLTIGSFRIWVRAVSTSGDIGPWSNPVDFTIAQVTGLSAETTLPESPLTQDLSLLPCRVPQKHREIPETKPFHEDLFLVTASESRDVAVAETIPVERPVSLDLMDLWMQEFATAPELLWAELDES